MNGQNYDNKGTCKNRADFTVLKGDQICLLKPCFFYDGKPYQVERSEFICNVNHLTGFYLIGTFVMKELPKSYVH